MANPSSFTSYGSDCPVELVSWNATRRANGFIAKLNQLPGATSFRLPTKAELKRTARGGTETRFSFGAALSGDVGCGGDAEADAYARCDANSGNKTQPAGTKSANPYGLHDM